MQKHKRTQLSASADIDRAGSMGSTRSTVKIGKERALREQRERKMQSREMSRKMGLSMEEMHRMEQLSKMDSIKVMSQYQEAFRRYDTDGSGSIDREELKEVLESLGDELNANEIDTILEEADTDGDGAIDYQEFCTMMEKRKRREMLAKEMTISIEKKRATGGSRGGLGFNALGEPITSFAPPLPPLRLDQIRQAKRHRKHPAPILFSLRSCATLSLPLYSVYTSVHLTDGLRTCNAQNHKQSGSTNRRRGGRGHGLIAT